MGDGDGGRDRCRRPVRVVAVPRPVAVLRCAEEAQMEVVERSFSIAEAQEADEAFITSASTFVMPVVAIDERKLGSGNPGPVAARLREIYLEESLKQAI